MHADTVDMLAHASARSGMSRSMLIRHLVALYAAGQLFDPLPSIPPHPAAIVYVDRLHKFGIGSKQ